MPVLFACNSQDRCDFLEVDDSVRIERDTPTELPVSIGTVPSDLLAIPRLKISAYGRPEGLRHWLVARDGNQRGHCESEPKAACSSLLDLESNTSFSTWLKGASAGRYDLELAFFEYRGQETLFEPPVCTRQIAVEVR